MTAPRPQGDHQHGELAVGWALHALEPEEEAEFLDHLGGCVECVRLVAETTATLEQLARAVPAVEPPPRLRAAILAAVEEDAAAEAVTLEDLAVEPPAAAHPARDDPEAPSTPTTQAAPVVPPASLASPRRRWVTRLVAAAAAVAVLAAVGGLVAANRNLQEQRDAQAAAAADSARVVQVLQDAGTPGAAHATLATSTGDLVGVVVDTGRGAEVATTGLPGNRNDQIYVLWGLAPARSAAPVPLGGFDVSGSAPSARSIGSIGESLPYVGYAVSLEPGRTVPASPTDIVASGQVGR